MDELTSFNSINFSLLDLTINFAIGVMLLTLIPLHYSYSAKKRVLRKDIALTLPVIGLTTLLIITVVKSSLVLSFDLVGPPSIEHFRTQIKEPQELAYIFIAISVGLFLGADQRKAAIAGIIIIFDRIFNLLSTLLKREKRDFKHFLYLSNTN